MTTGYGKSRFSVVTKANRQIHDENMYLNHCKDKGEDQYIKELCAAQVKKLNVAITNLREELKLKTNLLIQAAAEQTECIAKNEMKIAELQLYSDKLESTVDELKEAKRQIEILGKQLEMRDETVVSFESKIKELALKNSKLINRAHTYNNKLKTKVSIYEYTRSLLVINLVDYAGIAQNSKKTSRPEFGRKTKNNEIAHGSWLGLRVPQKSCWQLGGISTGTSGNYW